MNNYPNLNSGVYILSGSDSSINKCNKLEVKMSIERQQGQTIVPHFVSALYNYHDCLFTNKIHSNQLFSLVFYGCDWCVLHTPNKTPYNTYNPRITYTSINNIKRYMIQNILL